MKLEHNWRYKSLENLEKKVWPKVDYDSHLVTRTSQLRKIPLNEFSVEDLRIMIGQDIGLDYLIPLALEKLKENILSEGDFYPGDLLVALVHCDPGFWTKNEGYRRELEEMMRLNAELIIRHELKVKLP
jgi:hypothetical protein